MSEQEKRLALNEAMFREINERLESRITHVRRLKRSTEVLCECADPDCIDRIPLSLDEYRAVRADPRQFVVRPGHECVDVESVVNYKGRYEIVRKTGVAGEFAALLDPQ